MFRQQTDAAWMWQTRNITFFVIYEKESFPIPLSNRYVSVSISESEQTRAANQSTDCELESSNLLRFQTDKNKSILRFCNVVSFLLLLRSMLWWSLIVSVRWFVVFSLGYTFNDPCDMLALFSALRKRQKQEKAKPCT